MISRLVIITILTLTCCRAKENSYYQNFLKYLNEQHNLKVSYTSNDFFVLLDIHQCDDCLKSLIDILKTSQIECAKIIVAGKNDIEAQKLKQVLQPSNLFYYDKSKAYLQYEVGFFLAGIVHIVDGESQLYLDYRASQGEQLKLYLQQVDLCNE